MHVYRLTKAEYGDTLLTGRGGLVADGRWHTAGRPILYTATSEALTVLEVRVHLRRPLPHVAFALHVIEVPDESIRELAAADLPESWSSVPPRPESQAVGDTWLATASSLALRVPSVHSASDATVLLNPLHPEASRLVRIRPRAYIFDPRLF